MSHRRKIFKRKKTLRTGDKFKRKQVSLFGGKIKEKKKVEYKIICAKCGAHDTVPFYPRPGSRCLCKECFREMKQKQ